jgi:hypothetical protein
MSDVWMTEDEISDMLGIPEMIAACDAAQNLGDITIP